MVWCSVRYQSGYLDYQEFEFWSLTSRERSTWITSGNANSIIIRHNERAYREIFNNKLVFNKTFDHYLGRAWIDVRESLPSELEAFVTKHHEVMVKELDCLGGTGIEKYRASEIKSFQQFHADLLAHKQYLVEAFITQHPQMAALCSSSVNSLRMITFFDGVTVHILEAVLRMGNGAPVDNYARGGMYTVIDEKTGVANYGAFDKNSTIFTTHPITGVSIPGFSVPLYEDVLVLLDKAARVVPQIRYVGWDVAIGEHQPILIEGNYNTGVFQMKPSLTGNKIGLLPHFRKVISF
ncbi:MAG: sugar-transfer associated ATP-grasp domain-containing protein [Rhodoglobus sp.]